MRSIVGLAGISFCCKGHAALVLVVKKILIFFMASFVGAKEFVGGEIMRRESYYYRELCMILMGVLQPKAFLGIQVQANVTENNKRR